MRIPARNTRSSMRSRAHSVSCSTSVICAEGTGSGMRSVGGHDQAQRPHLFSSLGGHAVLLACPGSFILEPWRNRFPAVHALLPPLY